MKGNEAVDHLLSSPCSTGRGEAASGTKGADNGPHTHTNRKCVREADKEIHCQLLFLLPTIKQQLPHHSLPPPPPHAHTQFLGSSYFNYMTLYMAAIYIYTYIRIWQKINGPHSSPYVQLIKYIFTDFHPSVGTDMTF